MPAQVRKSLVEGVFEDIEAGGMIGSLNYPALMEIAKRKDTTSLEQAFEVLSAMGLVSKENESRSM